MRLLKTSKTARNALLFLVLSLLVSESVMLVGPAFAASQINVTVGTAKTGSNSLSLGFNLHGDESAFDSQPALRQLAEDCNPQLVRIFSYDFEPCTQWSDTTKTGTFKWTNVDLLVQRILGIGAEPFICIGNRDMHVGWQLPKGMGINSTTGLPYAASFAAYCSQWVNHFKSEGLAVRYYEIINEPWAYFGWNNYTLMGYYMNLFNSAAVAMRAANPNVLLGFDGTDRKPVLDYWLSNGGADLGFISFHKYDSGAIGEYSDSALFSRAETFMLQTDQCYYGVQDAQKTYYNARGKIIPVINSESNLDSICTNGTDPEIQQMVGAIWLALLLRTGILQGLEYSDYFTFSSSASYELSSKASGGMGFGMINYDNNQPWYPYYVQYMLGNNLNVGDKLLESSSSSSDLRVLTWLHNGKLTFLLICTTNQPLEVLLNGATGYANMQKIDNTTSWQTPSLQTSEIDLTEPITMNGYTVALLQAL
jgi:hypothetical protein